MSSSPACADDPDRVFVSLRPRDDNDPVSYRADRDEAIFLLGMLLIEDLEVLYGGAGGDGVRGVAYGAISRSG